jgi:hypothetical protein
MHLPEWVIHAGAVAAFCRCRAFISKVAAFYYEQCSLVLNAAKDLKVLSCCCALFRDCDLPSIDASLQFFDACE